MPMIPVLRCNDTQVSFYQCVSSEVLVVSNCRSSDKLSADNKDTRGTRHEDGAPFPVRILVRLGTFRISEILYSLPGAFVLDSSVAVDPNIFDQLQK